MHFWTSFSAKSALGCMAAALLGCVGGCVGSGAPRPLAASAPGASADRVRPPLVAVLPVVNLSGVSAPLQELRRALISRLEQQGFAVLPDKDQETFMARHRVRFTGGIDEPLAKAFREEAGVASVLISDLELFQSEDPPKFAMFARLVETSAAPRITWTGGAGQSGDDAPGFLNLGWISSPDALQGVALDRMTASLADYFRGGQLDVAGKARFGPRAFYRDARFATGRPLVIGILPFVNQSGRRFAGELMVLHFIAQFSRIGNCRPVEPGVLRELLLKNRIIIPAGVSRAEADILFAETDFDLLLSGKVLDYEDYSGSAGRPKVNFSVQVLTRNGMEVVWSSFSDNRGDEGVHFFELGKERTAHGLTANMAREVVSILTEPDETPAAGAQGEQQLAIKGGLGKITGLGRSAPGGFYRATRSTAGEPGQAERRVPGQ